MEEEKLEKEKLRESTIPPSGIMAASLLVVAAVTSRCQSRSQTIVEASKAMSEETAELDFQRKLDIAKPLTLGGAAARIPSALCFEFASQEQGKLVNQAIGW